MKTSAQIDNTALFLPNGSRLSCASNPPAKLNHSSWMGRRVSARFDAAETTPNNQRHWDMSTALSADAEANPHVRAILRNRARYEVANNSYAKGMLLTLANDVIGTGPRLQMLTDDDAFNSRIEKSFKKWAKAVHLAEKLRTMRMARTQDGEDFAIIANNPKVEHDVTLDLFVLESELVTGSLLSNSVDPREIDGIYFDDFDNPVKYRVLKHHPGNNRYFSIGENDYVFVNAKDMIHYFRKDRPGQHRGVPEITPALPLFAQLRRYTLAVIDAAEAAANISGVVRSNMPPELEEGDFGDSPEPMDPIYMERNTFLTMPMGWDINQIDAKQPTSTYKEFKNEILNEIARCLNMPFNVAAGNSSNYNYASGRLDFQTYFKSISVDREFTEMLVLDRLLNEWLKEFMLLEGLYIRGGMPPHMWFWDGTEHVDPAKEAKAQETRLKNRSTNLAIEYSRQGRDWEVEAHQIAKEDLLELELEMQKIAYSKELMKKYKLTEEDISQKEKTDV